MRQPHLRKEQQIHAPDCSQPSFAAQPELYQHISQPPSSIVLGRLCRTGLTGERNEKGLVDATNAGAAGTLGVATTTGGAADELVDATNEAAAVATAAALGLLDATNEAAALATLGVVSTAAEAAEPSAALLAWAAESRAAPAGSPDMLDARGIDASLALASLRA
jgi:hypothetical protein